VKKQARQILDVLKRDNEWHSALEFKRGTHGFYVDAVSQRIGELVHEGWPIETSGAGGHEPGRYRWTGPVAKAEKPKPQSEALW